MDRPFRVIAYSHTALILWTLFAPQAMRGFAQLVQEPPEVEMFTICGKADATVHF